MGAMYTASFAPSAQTAALDFFEITPADDKICVIHAVYVSQTTEVGDAQEEMCEWTIRRGGTGMTSGSGGVAAANGVGLDPTYATSGFTFEARNTTVATFTSGVIVHDDAFNVRVGLIYIPTPEMRPKVSQGNGGLVVRLEAAPIDSVTWVGTMYVEEIG